jgi:hypothetical protein
MKGLHFDVGELSPDGFHCQADGRGKMTVHGRGSSQEAEGLSDPGIVLDCVHLAVLVQRDYKVVHFGQAGE